MTHGSLNNLLAGTNPELKPEVGMGATLVSWTDRHPYTIVRVSPSGKTVWVKEDNYKRTDENGMSECQNYEFTSNDASPEIMVRKKKNGQWASKGTKFTLGSRSKYHDYSF